MYTEDFDCLCELSDKATDEEIMDIFETDDQEDIKSHILPTSK